MKFRLLILMSCLLATAALAAGKPAPKKQQIEAPNLEDHANYFSQSRQGVSPEAAREADKIRLKTITSIKSLLEDKTKKGRRFELQLRLGELYVERHDYLRDIELQQYDQQAQAWEKKDAKTRGPEPKLDNRNSIEQLTRAANAFRQLVNEFPKDSRTDAALYSLGKTLARLGKDTAANYYKQLISSFPKSPLLPDAYLALGEFYFEKHQIGEALANYKAVVSKFKNSKVYPYAVYKLGWAFYNTDSKTDKEALENYQKAVTAFKLVVKLATAAKEEDKALSSNLDLRQEAIRDLIVVWAEAKDVNSAWKYFKTIGEKESFYTMLERLGTIYTDNGENKNAIEIYTRLLRESPNRLSNPDTSAKLAQLYDLVGDKPNVVATLNMMNSTYVKDGAWVAANANNPAEVKAAEATVEKNLHRYGAMYHSQGAKTKNNGLLAAAASIYSYYLASFPENENAYEIRYYMAEILFEFKKWEQASENYVKVSKQPKQTKYQKPAALAAVVAINNLIKEGSFQKLPPAGQVASPIEIPAQKKKLIQVIDNYVSLLPAEADGKPMRFEAAQVFFDYGHYDDAVKRYGAITAEIPGTKQSENAVKLILAYYDSKSKWDEVIKWSEKFEDTKGLLDQPLAKFVTEAKRAAMFKQALGFDKAGQYDKSAAEFLRYQKTFPADANADRALYNATGNFYKLGRVEEAIDTARKLLKDYPKSELAPDIIVQLSETYEGLAQFDSAADFYLKLANQYTSDKRAPNALFNAAVLYKGLGNRDLAVKLMDEFATKYPKHSLTGGALLESADMKSRLNNHKGALQTYEMYVNNFRSDPEQSLFAEARVATINLAHLDTAKGAKQAEIVRQKLVRKDAPNAYEARRILAQAIFKNLETRFVDYRSATIAGGPNLEKMVKAKQDKLIALADGYKAIIEVGNVEMMAASLYRLGEAHENFAQVLFTATPPPGASQSDLDKFRTELEKVAFPLKEEAHKLFETAHLRAQEMDTFSPWTQRTYKKMVEINPEKYPKLTDLVADASYVGHEVKWDKAVAGLVESK